jgi:hypothetical protein
MAKKKISTRQWERFRKHIIYWQVLLGLQDWGVTCVLATPAQCKDTKAEDEADDENSITTAWVSDDSEHHLATIYLRNDVLEHGVTPADIDKVAFHEMCHLLLTPIENLALLGSPDNAVRREIHRLIRVLENTFYEAQKKELEES